MKSAPDHAIPPSPSAVTIVTGPWTPEARQLAFDRAVHEHYLTYFARAVKQRNWSPWHDLPVEEMHERGHLLSEDTANLIEGFMGVEEFVVEFHAHLKECAQRKRDQDVIRERDQARG